MAIGLAAQINAWGQRWPYAGYGLPEAGAGAPPVDFPDVKLRIAVELLINGAWVNISEYVKYESGITGTAGRTNEAPTAPAATCRLELFNADRRFSSKNPLSPYYPYLQLGTKLRVTVNPGSGDSLQFTGEVPEWPPRWTNGDDRSVAIEASGSLRRFEQGENPAYSALRRSYTTAVTQPVAYWPLEGGRDAVTLYDLITGAPSAIGGFAYTDGTAGVATFGVGSLGPGSDAVANISGGFNLDLTLPTDIAATSEITLEFSVAFGTTVRTGTYSKCGIRHNPSVAARHLAWNVFINDSGLIELQWFEADRFFNLAAGPTTVYSAGSENIFDGQPRVFHLDLTASGGTNVAWVLYENDTLLGSGTVTPSFAGAMDAPPYRAACVSTTGADDVSAMGHVAVFTENITADRYSALTGHLGELPTDRFARLLQEEAIPYVVDELIVDTEGMGPQGISTIIRLLEECAQTNEGVINETRANELRLSSRTARWSPEVALLIDYAHPVYGNQVYGIAPTDDDFALRNDWTVGREGGLSAQAEQLTGPLNVNDPEDDPEGVRRRRDSATLSLQEDGQAGQHATWRLRKGTVDELRYKEISIALHRNPELIPAWLASDLSRRLRILNPPADVGPDDIDQFIEGYVWALDQFTWYVVINSSPVNAGEAWTYDDPSGAARYDCAGSTLSEDLDTTETGIDIAITDDCVWAHDNGDYLIRIHGEDMLVTAVSAAAGTYPSQTQTLTVTRSMNGAVLSHPVGTAVRLRHPVRYAL